MRARLILGLLLAVAAMVFVIVPTATAGGQSDEGPQYTTTNIPYLAWNGEEVRLVKCYDEPAIDEGLTPVTTNLGAALTKAEFNVLRWSGTTRDPALETNTVTTFMDGRQLCVRGDFVSLNPGLATIEMDVTIDWSIIFPSDENGLVAYPKHMFLAAWMTMLQPTLGELSNAGLDTLSANQDTGANGAVVHLLHDNYSADSPTAVPTSGVQLGDPLGDGSFQPIADGNGVAHLYDGLMSVRVKGQFPDPAAPGGMWTMPDDWAALAAIYETDPTGHDPAMWDIHNSLSWAASLTEGMGISDPWVKGPFDPLFGETVLPNKALDAGDAPMPAARVDFSIAPGGVGGFDPVEKHWVYTADAASAPTYPNLYAPFYSQYIPATYRDYEGVASGVDGPAQGNDFQGFLVDGKYTNWSFLQPATNDPLRYGDPNVCKDEYGNTRVSPVGVPDTVSVYTDEHGEAMVAYNPDRGFYFQAGDNNTCDLGRNVPDGATASTAGSPVLLGMSAITATAFYPYKSVAPLSQSIPSNTLVKKVYGDPAKFLTCIPKDDRTDVAFCVETIRDLYGNPVAGAKVQFTAQPGAKLVPAALDFGGFDTTGQSTFGPPSDVYANVKTNALGQAGVEVISTLKGQVDLLAENLDTRNGGAGITRDACINFYGTGVPIATYTVGGCATDDPPIVVDPPVADGGSPDNGGSTDNGGTTGGTGGSTTSTGSKTSGGSTVVTKPTAAPKPAVAPKPAATPKPALKTKHVVKAKHVVKTRLVAKRLVATTHGRYLRVKVRSALHRATIRVTLIGRHGKVLRVVKRRVVTNRLVRVRHLTIAKHVHGMKVLRVKVALVR